MNRSIARFFPSTDIRGRAPRLLACVALLAALALPGPTGAVVGIGDDDSEAFVPNQIIVKLRPEAARVAKRAVRGGFVNLMNDPGASSLDTLRQRHRVRRMRRVFRSLEAPDGKLRHTARERVLGRLQRRGVRTSAALLRRLERVPDLENVFVIETEDGASVPELVAEFGRDENVVYAQPNFIYRAHAEPLPPLPFVPDDPYVTQDGMTWSEGSFDQAFPDLYGLRNVRAIEAWNEMDTDDSGDFGPGETRPGEGIVVAVIDTGVDAGHPDIAPNMWENPDEIPGNGIDDDGNGQIDDVHGWDFIEDDDDPADPAGHGTHVAGAIAGVVNDATGMAGLAPWVEIMPVRAMDALGSGESEGFAAAVDYAVQSGAHIINASWGYPWFDQVVADAFAAAEAEDVLSVSSAGNRSRQVGFDTPAGLDGVLAVAAVDHEDELAPFSNFGFGIEISAPGVEVLSLNANGGDNTYARIVGDQPVHPDHLVGSGTSMACPHVAGAAAVLMSFRPSETPPEIRGRLLAGADDIEAANPGFEGWLGAGRLDLLESLTTTETPVIRIKTVEESDFTAGRQAEIVVELRNFWAAATDVTALLSTSEPLVTIQSASADFGDLALGEANSNASAPFVAGLDAAIPYGPVLFSLDVTSAEGHQTTLRFAVTVPYFTDVTAEANLPSGATGALYAKLQDYSGDGFSDALVILSHPPPEVLFSRNLGDGSFADANQELGIESSRNAAEVLFIDIDNDGDRDVLLAGGHHIGSGSGLLLSNGDGSTSDISVSSGISSVAMYTAVALDYNNDGFVDVLGTHYTKEVPLYLLENQGYRGELAFLDKRIAAGLPEHMASGAKTRPLTFDYDDDGDADLLFATERNISEGDPGGLDLYRNNGDGTFSRVTPQAFDDVVAEGQRRPSAGDYDNDGDVDILITGKAPESGPPTRVLRNNGDGTFSDAAASTGELAEVNIRGTPYPGSEFFDFDNDGDLDLYVSKDLSGRSDLDSLYTHSLFANDGTGSFVLVNDEAYPREIGPAYAAAAIGDYDNDGDLDLYAPRSFTGGSGGGLLCNEVGQENHWIKVALVGTESTRNAYAARVIVESDGGTQLREVRSSTVDVSNLHFGLGSATAVHRIEVRWPSGIVESFEDVAADQFFTIVEVDCGVGQDSDADGVCDVTDNCSAVPNTDQLDTNQDGLGNICDGDFDDDGIVGMSDYALISRAYGSSAVDPEYVPDIDMDGDGTVGADDWDLFFSYFFAPPGPSGLSCAGMIPCP